MFKEEFPNNNLNFKSNKFLRTLMKCFTKKNPKMKFRTKLKLSMLNAAVLKPNGN